MGVLLMVALVFGVYIKAPDFFQLLFEIGFLSFYYP